jgi:hypothetical protein
LRPRALQYLVVAIGEKSCVIAIQHGGQKMYRPIAVVKETRNLMLEGTILERFTAAGQKSERHSRILK